MLSSNEMVITETIAIIALALGFYPIISYEFCLFVFRSLFGRVGRLCVFKETPSICLPTVEPSSLARFPS